MRINEYRGNYPLSLIDQAKAIVELTHEDVSEITNALYKRMKKHPYPEQKRRYSDFMILLQLLESGTVDDWTVEQIATYRGMTGIEQVDDDEPDFLPVETKTIKKEEEN